MLKLRTLLYFYTRTKMEQAKTMRAIVLEGPMKMSVQEIPIPKPQEGEVLIKVMAAPINPSDLIFLHQGQYEHKKTPCTPGFEGSGIVVENGGGMMGWGIMNKRVAFSPTITTGSYAQYALAKSGQCLPIDQAVSFEHASMSFVNPLTAMALLDHTKQRKSKTVIVNAAASALGRMINRIFPPQGIEIINIVRKEEQVEVLRKQGANYIINSSEPEFEQRLKQMATKMNAKVCFDAIGGQMTGKMVRAMPKNSIVYVYGALDGPTVHGIDVKSFIYDNITVTGFFLPNWLQGRGILKILPTMMKLRNKIKNQLKSDIAFECSLDEFQDSAKWYYKNMTKGKVILQPFGEGGKLKQRLESIKAETPIVEGKKEEQK